MDANEQLVNQITNSLQNDFIAKEAMLQEKSEKLDLEIKNQKKLIDSKVFEIEQQLKKEIHLDAMNKAEQENKLSLLQKELEKKNIQLENYRNSEIDYEKSKIIKIS